jgi:hypothetical protein
MDFESIRWEKGGGGVAGIIRLLGIAGRSEEVEELLLTLEKEQVTPALTLTLTYSIEIGLM